MTLGYRRQDLSTSSSHVENLSGERFLDMVEDEFISLPTIKTLDDYSHFRGQLEAMRARSVGEMVPARFAMELALYSRLCDYEARLGLPQGFMPEPDGNGGIRYPSALPEEWLA